MSLRIGVADLSPEGLSFSGEEQGDVLELAAEDEIQPGGPVSYALHACRVGNDLIVSGQVRTRVLCECRRCAASFPTEIAEEQFQLVEAIGEEGEEVDLTPFIRESILLRLPAHPVCRKDCKGLCPTCGADLNKGSCGCKPDGEGWRGVSDLDELM